MKLASLYSNFEDIFPRIVFSEGLNVIFGRVKDKKLSEKDSHNLGKTFLITVIEFCLLSDIKEDHAFKKHIGQFGDFIFFLEIETNDGRHITVRRSVKNLNKIFIGVERERNKVLIGLPDDQWTHANLSLAKGVEKLNDYLDLNVILPFKYRKGLSYCLRRQNDYNDEFRTSKFVISKDVFWKPYVATILGFDPSALNKKYELDTQIEKEQVKQKNLESDAGSTSGEFDELKGIIQLREGQLHRLKLDLDKMDFRRGDKHIIEEQLSKIDSELQNLNEKLYLIEVDINQIDKSLNSDYSFDLENIEKVYKEAYIAFPQTLKKNYEDLIEFNQRLSKSRKEHLRMLRQNSLENKSRLEVDSARFTDQRGELLSELIEVEAFEKFKRAQKEVISRDTELIELKANLKNLNQAGEIESNLRKLKIERNEVIEEVKQEIRKDDETYTIIRKNFSSNVERILNTQALLSVSVNSFGNLDFKIKTIDSDIEGRETSEGAGTSYKKMLCACFDMAVLATYSKLSFYRFVYHDGIFEGLDNRRKVNLLNTVRELCYEYGIQYILSVIDSDLPRDNTDNALLFKSGEIVRSLHDDGDDGRLFKMRKF